MATISPEVTEDLKSAVYLMKSMEGSNEHETAVEIEDTKGETEEGMVKRLRLVKLNKV